MPVATIRCRPIRTALPTTPAMPTTVNLRLALWALLGMALFLNYQMWSHDYVALVPPVPLGANAAPAAPLDSTVPSATLPVSATPPATDAPAGNAGATAGATAERPPALQAEAALAASVHVVADVLDAEVSLAGGELRRVDLPAYPAAKNTPDVPVRLLNRDGADSLFVLQSGLGAAEI